MATEDTRPLWPSNVFRHSPSVFHIFTVLSQDPLTIRSGPKMATEIHDHCGLPMSLGTRHPYSISLRYCPIDPLTIRSGPKMATEDTPSLWPSNVFRHSPSVFHIFTVLSKIR